MMKGIKSIGHLLQQKRGIEMKKMIKKLPLINVVMVSLLVFSQLVLSVEVLAASLPEVSHDVFVYDDTDLLSQTTKEFIINLNKQYEQTDEKPQLAVALVNSLQELTIAEYANQLFNKWGIGQVDSDNGVLLVIAPNERQVRIEVGYGLEETLTDSVTKWLLTTNRSLMSEGKFDEACIEMVTALVVAMNDYYQFESDDSLGDKLIDVSEYRHSERDVTSYEERDSSKSNFFTENGWFILLFIVVTFLEMIFGNGGSDSGSSSGGWSGGSSSGGGSNFGGGSSGGGGSSSSF